MRPVESGPDAAGKTSLETSPVDSEEPSCFQCGYPVTERPLGCRWPCPNCGFLYPRGDCSD
jgi:predicted RNA-binding Zn-ribbon protein involved in translation (DUF1610 family)